MFQGHPLELNNMAKSKGTVHTDSVCVGKGRTRVEAGGKLSLKRSQAFRRTYRVIGSLKDSNKNEPTQKEK